jgi:hypothetical protein
MVELTRPEDILNEAVRVWNISKLEHRDASIRIGRLLIDYIIACLKETDGKPEADRISSMLTREAFMENAAERLEMKLSHAWDKVRIARVVELLGDPGTLSSSSLRAFAVLVRRKPLKVVRGRKINANRSEVLPSESEVWEIKPDTVGRDPRDLYKQAVEEVWGSVQIREAIKSSIEVKRRGGSGPKRKLKPGGDKVTSAHEKSAPLSFRSLGESTNPKDLADMIDEMIQACPNSNELKRLLRERIG